MDVEEQTHLISCMIEEVGWCYGYPGGWLQCN
jgi:hypothetical protein